VFAPTLAQVNEEGETKSVTAPQTSKLPLSTCAAVMLDVPAEFRLMEMF